MPESFRTVTPRMVVEDVVGAVDFMRATFDATGDIHPERPVELRIGDSVVMVSEVGEREAFPVFLYVYVEDADVTYGRAVDAGAIVLEEPLDTPYGDRRAMVRDAAGNIFQIAHQLPGTP
jgi:PhnB protein